MEPIVQKAAKGNRAALTQLCDSNKNAIYSLCKALLRGDVAATAATKWALRSALRALPNGELQTAADFSAYAVRQAANYCKKEVTKKDRNAFRLPPQKDFRLSRINEQDIIPGAGAAENYINCLPALQRFVLVLRLAGNMSAEQIGKVIGLDADAVTLAIQAEPENLDKICRAVRARGGQCALPDSAALEAAFAEARKQTVVPDEIGTSISAYIDAVAAPAEAAARRRTRTVVVIAAAVLVVCAILLGVILSGGDAAPTADSTESTADTQEKADSGETEDATESVIASEVETESTSGMEDIPIYVDELDLDYVYYADIAVEGYGTITVQLDPEAAPITAANFVTLAVNGFYDGLTFHRIIEDFMMQGGDPNGDGTGGSGSTIVGEFTDNGYDNTLSHTRGAISMARSSAYDSASSQFFICHVDATALDGQYAVFGYVTDGMDIVDAICAAAQPTDSNGTIPAEEQPVITEIRIVK